MDRANAFETDLDRNPANYAPLTPLSFIEQAAAVYPERTAVVRSGANGSTWTPNLVKLVLLKGMREPVHTAAASPPLPLHALLRFSTLQPGSNQQK